MEEKQRNPIRAVKRRCSKKLGRCVTTGGVKNLLTCSESRHDSTPVPDRMTPPPPEPFRHQYVLTYTTSHTKILCFLAQIVENNQKVIYVLDRKEQKRSLLSFKTITVLIFLICHVWSYHKPYLVVTATLFINELWPDPWCSWPSGTDDMLYVQTGQRCQSLGSVTSAGSHWVTITALNRWK